MHKWWGGYSGCYSQAHLQRILNVLLALQLPWFLILTMAVAKQVSLPWGSFHSNSYSKTRTIIPKYKFKHIFYWKPLMAPFMYKIKAHILNAVFSPFYSMTWTPNSSAYLSVGLSFPFFTSLSSPLHSHSHLSLLFLLPKLYSYYGSIVTYFTLYILACTPKIIFVSS